MRWLYPLLAALAAVPDPFDDSFLAAAALPGARAPAPSSKRSRRRPLRLRGAGASPGVVLGTARVLLSVADLKTVSQGDIVIVRWFGPVYAPLLPQAGGIVAERGGPLSAGAALGREWRIPMVVGVHDATLLVRTTS